MNNNKMAHINPIAVFEGQEISMYQICDLPNDFELDLFLYYKELKTEMEKFPSQIDKSGFLQSRVSNSMEQHDRT